MMSHNILDRDRSNALHRQPIVLIKAQNNKQNICGLYQHIHLELLSGAENEDSKNKSQIYFTKKKVSKLNRFLAASQLKNFWIRQTESMSDTGRNRRTLHFFFVPATVIYKSRAAPARFQLLFTGYGCRPNGKPCTSLVWSSYFPG